MVYGTRKFNVATKTVPAFHGAMGCSQSGDQGKLLSLGWESILKSLRFFLFFLDVKFKVFLGKIIMW